MRKPAPSGPWTIHLAKNPNRCSAAWYRWEFLRRNPQYRKDYAAFRGRFDEFIQRSGFWYSEAVVFWTRQERNYYFRKIKPTLDGLCEKWRVSDLFPPDWKFDKESAQRKFERGEIRVPTESGLDIERLKALFPWGFTGQGGSARRISNYLVIEFDLTWPMKDMVEYAKRALSHGQSSFFDEAKGLGISLPKSRRRFTDYDRHLKAWDFRQRGNSIPKIAHILFPAEVHELGKSAVLQKVRDHIRAAEKLIDGQYKEIK